MPYSQFTQAQFVAAISLAMEDPGNLYWSFDEVARAINEGLLYWGQLTSYWRERGTFQSSPNTFFYDLQAELPTLRQSTYTLDDLCIEVQYALFELATGVAGTGLTAQFTPSQITAAVIAAADQVNLDLGIPQFNPLVNLATAPPDGRVQLDQSVVAISRVSFQEALTGIWTTLRREDEFSAQSASPDWNLTPGLSRAYSMATAPPLVLQLIPPPRSSGALSLLYNQSLTLPVAPATLLTLPNEYVHAVKWYALYLLLNSYNEAVDPYRAKYCLERYQQFVSATNDDMHALTRVQINGRLIPLDTIWNLDAGYPFWMNLTGTPIYAATAWNVLALAPIAGTTPCSITCDVVRSAPLPLTQASFIQLGREELSYITDYVRHILSFKIGGTEFGATFQLYDNFLSGAKARNKLLSDRVRYLSSLFDQATLNESQSPTA